MHIKKHLSFSGPRKTISKRLLQIEEFRKGDVEYTLHDCFMSGVAMMFFQDPSLLQFQRRLQEKIHRNNLKTVFNVSAIPKDSQLKDVLDAAPTDELEKVFSDFFQPPSKRQTPCSLSASYQLSVLFRPLSGKKGGEMDGKGYLLET